MFPDSSIDSSVCSVCPVFDLSTDLDSCVCSVCPVFDLSTDLDSRVCPAFDLSTDLDLSKLNGLFWTHLNLTVFKPNDAFQINGQVKVN